MTDLSRSSTLSLRRPAAALTSRSKSMTATVNPASPGAKPVVERGEASDSTERAVHSEALLQGHSHISIKHNGETYQLRATRLGKLILTK